MPANPNSVAVDMSNRIIAAMQDFALLQSKLESMNQIYISNQVGSTISAFPTCAVNADGTLGTADVTPSTADGHVIDPRAVSGLSRSTTAFNLGSALTLIQQFLNLVKGQVVTTQPSAPDLIAEFNGG